VLIFKSPKVRYVKHIFKHPHGRRFQEVCASPVTLAGEGGGGGFSGSGKTFSKTHIQNR
jgi:hypothetical protein